MWNVVVCDGDESEREQLLAHIRRFGRKENREIRTTGCADWPALFERLTLSEPDVIVVAQNGVEGLDTLSNIHLPPERFIWFSDLDFSLQAYRMCVSWFGIKPVTYEKVAQALTRYFERAADGK